MSMHFICSRIKKANAKFVSGFGNLSERLYRDAEVMENNLQDDWGGAARR